MSLRRKRVWLWLTGIAVVVILGVVAWYVVPILTHPSGGSSGQSLSGEAFPSSVTATGSDGRTRTLSAFEEDGQTPADLSAVQDSAHIVVTGTGYDSGTGIYVAVCQRPADASEKPSPCLGGVPEVSGEVDTEQWAASAWINDSASWQLFGAQAWGEEGSFTVRLAVAASDGTLDCRQVECAIYTRADHTAAADRTQDMFLPLNFVD
ncbi:MAG TPA: hypothetical protein GX406_04145 [Pseudoclavibacter sp.]|nr:hypothetical protein [Pseudoclavibacter sp.]